VSDSFASWRPLWGGAVALNLRTGVRHLDYEKNGLTVIPAAVSG